MEYVISVIMAVIVFYSPYLVADAMNVLEAERAREVSAHTVHVEAPETVSKQLGSAIVLNVVSL